MANRVAQGLMLDWADGEGLPKGRVEKELEGESAREESAVVQEYRGQVVLGSQGNRKAQAWRGHAPPRTHRTAH